MKKLLSILTIAALITACNNSSTETTTATDSAVLKESPLMDAENTADSVNKLIDSAHNHPTTDTSIKK